MPFILSEKIDLLEPAGEIASKTGERMQRYRKWRTGAALMSDRGRKELEDSVLIPSSQVRYVVRFRRNLSTAWKAVINGISYDVSDVANIPGERPKSYLMLLLERANQNYSIVQKPQVHVPIPPPDPSLHTRYLAWSNHTDFTEHEILAGDSIVGDATTITIPARAKNGYLGVFYPISLGDLQELYIDGNNIPQYQRQGNSEQGAGGAFSQSDNDILLHEVVYRGFITNQVQDASIIGTGNRSIRMVF